MKGFEIGKRIVVVDDTPVFEGTPKKPFKKGDIFVVLGIKEMECCGVLAVDIGMKLRYRCKFHCKCGCSTIELLGEIHWFGSFRFVPIEEVDFKQVAFTKVIEHVPIGAN